MQQNRFLGLDFARAFAIVLVLLSHFFKNFDILGFFGVEIFFALSGYLLGQIMWRIFDKDVSLSTMFNFWQRRWFRTIPNYFLFLLIMILFHIYIKHDNLSWAVVREYFYFGQNLLKNSTGFYEISWSLCVEEWFYLLFPVPIYLLRKLGFRNLPSFIIVVVFFYISCFLIRNYLLVEGFHNIRMIALGRLDAITSGVLVALIKLNFKEIKTDRLALAGVFLLIISFSLMFTSIQSYSTNSVVLFLVPFSFSFFLPQMEQIKFSKNKFKLIRNFITNLSLWSYSIYLSHIPILFTLYYFTDHLTSSLFDKLLVKIIGLGLTIVISKFIYKYFEIPLTNKRPKECSNT